MFKSRRLEKITTSDADEKFITLKYLEDFFFRTQMFYFPSRFAVEKKVLTLFFFRRRASLNANLV